MLIFIISLFASQLIYMEKMLISVKLAADSRFALEKMNTIFIRAALEA